MVRAELINKADMTQRTWDEKLDIILRDCNLAGTYANGVSPFELARGRIPTSQHLSWIEKCPQRTIQSKLSWEKIRQRSSEAQTITSKTVNNQYNRRLRRLKLGSLVKRTNFQQMLGRSRSLMPKFDGPYTVMRQLSPTMYEIGIPGKKWRQSLHVDHLISLKISKNEQNIKIHPNPVGRPTLMGGEM